MHITTSDETHLCCSYNHFLNSTRLLPQRLPPSLQDGPSPPPSGYRMHSCLSISMVPVSLTAVRYNPTWIFPYDGSLQTDGSMSSWAERYRQFEYVNDEMQINSWFARIENKNGTIYMCSLRSCLSKMSTLFVLGSIECRLTCWTKNCAETSYMSL